MVIGVIPQQAVLQAMLQAMGKAIGYALGYALARLRVTRLCVRLAKR